MKDTTSQSRMRHTLLSASLAVALAGASGVAAAAPGDAAGTATPRALRDFTATPRIDPRAEEWKRLHPPPPAHPDGGITHVVTNCDDDGAGSLRSAVTAAADGDTIDLTSLACSSITLATGALVTGAANLEFNGPGRDLLSVSGDSASPVIVHLGAGQLTVGGMTVVSGVKYSDGPATAAGGCIYSQGNVALIDAGAKYCTARANGDGDALGGAVYARGGAVLIGTTISGSLASSASGLAGGGGLYTPGNASSKYSVFRGNAAHTDSGGGYGGGAMIGGDASIVRSTVHANSGGGVAGLALTGVNATGELLLDHVTITDNHASTSLSGAGVYVGGNAQVRNSTITGNVEGNPVHAKYGAGLAALPGTIELTNSIIAGNSLYDGSEHLPSDIGAAFSTDPPTITGSHNLVGTSVSIMPPDTLFTTDPRLAPLDSNGGSTPTMALMTGSLAFNAGTGGEGHDQRGPGYPRLVGAGVDIGAFESDALLVDGFD